MKKIIIAIAILFSTGAFAQPLKIAVAKGTKYEVSTVTKVNSSASIMGQDMETNLDNTSVEVYEIKDARATETDLTKVVTKMVVSMQSMGQDMNYDSEKKDNSGPLAESLDKTVNKVKNITIDANGKIIKEDKDDSEASGMGGLMALSPASGGVSIFKLSLVGKEMKVAANWSDSTNNDAEKLKSNTVGTYTITAIEGNIATISFDGVQRMSGTVEQMGQEMGMSGSNKITGTYKVDLSNGLILSSTTSTTGTSSIEAMGMSIPVNTKTTTTATTKVL